MMSAYTITPTLTLLSNTAVPYVLFPGVSGHYMHLCIPLHLVLTLDPLAKP